MWSYADTSVLVSTDWVADHLEDPSVRLIECNYDPQIYPAGHLPGAVAVDWDRDLNNETIRDYIDASSVQTLLRTCGIHPDTKVVLYGHFFNWLACNYYWILTMYGLTNLYIMDGGRLKWQQEDRALVDDIPQYEEGSIEVGERDESKHRIRLRDFLNYQEKGLPILDVRSTAEYRGERVHMEGFPNDGALRSGRIPGARHIPWTLAMNMDNGTFKKPEALREIYVKLAGLDTEQPLVTYCRIGKRSSHSWFVLTHLAGFSNVRNYDGSWLEWGNLIGAPIEK